MSTQLTTGAPAARRIVLAVAWVIYLAVAAACVAYLVHDLHGLVGRRGLAYGLVFALLPAPFLIAAFVLLDRLRPAPVSLIVVCLVWGSCIATLIALQVNGSLSDAIGGRGSHAVRDAVFIAPWVEETAKGVVIFVIVWAQRTRVTTAVTGVVYGGLIGIGFAFTENVVYYSQVFTQNIREGHGSGSALNAVQQLFWWRGVAAPFVHPMFTLLTGLGLGLAIRHRNVGVRVLAPVAGFLGAVLLHMSYNTVASYASNRALTSVYVGILLPTVVTVVVGILLLRRYERRVWFARLHDYVVFGWVDERVCDAVANRSGRARLRRTAAGRELIRAAVELGVVRDLIVRGVAGATEHERERDLASTVRRLTPAAMPPAAIDPSSPGAWALGVAG